MALILGPRGPRRPVSVRVQLPTFERQTSTIGVIRAGGGPVRKQRPVYPPQQSGQTTFVGRADDDDSGTFGGWEPAIVEIVAVECHERTPKLPCETIVLPVPCPAELIVLEDKRTSHSSWTRMKSTSPAGTFASAYTRGFDDSRSACGPVRMIRCPYKKEDRRQNTGGRRQKENQTIF